MEILPGNNFDLSLYLKEATDGRDLVSLLILFQLVIKVNADDFLG